MIFPVILDLGPLLQTFLAATSPIYHFPFSQTLNMGKILDLSKNAIHVKDCFSLVGFCRDGKSNKNSRDTKKAQKYKHQKIAKNSVNDH